MLKSELFPIQFVGVDLPHEGEGNARNGNLFGQAEGCACIPYREAYEVLCTDVQEICASLNVTEEGRVLSKRS
jgi:hypothetical protein